MAVPIMWFSSSSISKSVLRQFLDSMVQPTIDRKYALAVYLHSFLPSTVKLWNELSSELISLHTQVTFKSWLLSSVF